jgi:2'-5' RNA ligase
MTGVRSFIAVEVANEQILARIGNILQDLVATRADLKPVEPENMHFTLHFLGDVDASRLPELQSILQEIDVPVFDAQLKGLGCFSPNRPRVVWVGVTTGADQLIQIQGFLGARLREQRFPVEGRKFSPHLTVARVRGGANRVQLLRVIDKNANLDFGLLHVTAVKLKKSTLTPRGPIYEDLEVKKLTEG